MGAGNILSYLLIKHFKWLFLTVLDSLPNAGVDGHGGVRIYKELIRPRMHKNGKIWEGFMQSSVCPRSGP